MLDLCLFIGRVGDGGGCRRYTWRPCCCGSNVFFFSDGLQVFWTYVITKRKQSSKLVLQCCFFQGTWVSDLVTEQRFCSMKLKSANMTAICRVTTPPNGLWLTLFFAAQNRQKIKIFSLPAAWRLFSRGMIFTRARVSPALLSLRKNGGLLVVYLRLS